MTAKLDSLRKKIALSFLGVIVFTGTLFMYFAHQTGFEMLQKQEYAMGENVQGVIKSVLDNIFESGRHDNLQSVLENALKTHGAKDILLLKKDGTISMSAEKQREFEVFPLHELKNMPDKDPSRYLSRMKESVLYFYIMEPIASSPKCYTCHKDPQIVEGSVVVKVEMNMLRESAKEHRTTTIINTVLTFLGIGFVLFLTISIQVIQPIQKLRTYIHQLQNEIPKIESGVSDQLPFQKKISGSADEIGELERGFDKVVHILNEAYKTIFSLHKVQLGYADRLANTGEIAASVAHEIKNPVAGLTGALQILKSDYPVNDAKHGIILEMLHQLKLMDQSVNDLLAYARPKPPVMASVKISDIIDRTLILLPHANKNSAITIEWYIDTKEISIVADDKQIQQVFWNICMNSIQAMERGGVLKVSASKKGDFVNLTIQDTGTGIPEDHLPKIFRPFFTTKHKGSGLGLSISKQIIEDHQGSITVTSIVGAGTTVVISLPIDKSVRNEK